MGVVCQYMEGVCIAGGRLTVRRLYDRLHKLVCQCVWGYCVSLCGGGWGVSCVWVCGASVCGRMLVCQCVGVGRVSTVGGCGVSVRSMRW